MRGIRCSDEGSGEGDRDEGSGVKEVVHMPV
jgi:hypothetical protein